MLKFNHYTEKKSHVWSHQYSLFCSRLLVTTPQDNYITAHILELNYVAAHILGSNYLTAHLLYQKLCHSAYNWPKLHYCIYKLRQSSVGYLNVLIISLQSLSLEPPVHLIPTNTSPTNYQFLHLRSMFHDIVFLDPIVLDFAPYFNLNLTPLTLVMMQFRSFQRMC